MAEMERFARRGRRAGTHAGTETCPRHVSLALLVPCSNLSGLIKTHPRPMAGVCFSWRRWRDSAAFAPCVRRRKSKYRPVFELVDEGPAGAFDPHSNLSILYEKHIPRPKGGGYVFMAEMERFELSRSF